VSAHSATRRLPAAVGSVARLHSVWYARYARAPRSRVKYVEGCACGRFSTRIPVANRVQERGAVEERAQSEGKEAETAEDRLMRSAGS